MSGSSNTEKHSFGPLGISDLFGVEGFKCVVTGGGTGIGLMVAQGLARNGATVYITGRRKEALEKVCKEYNDPKHGGKIIAFVFISQYSS
jgi:NAD(P)-dependent dehydrogenase (short-subunit alcohol dehydrogenase family)